MKTLINGRLILPDAYGNFQTVTGKALTFDEKIISIGAIPDGTELIDAAGAYVAPGFINVHIHGAGGFDTMDDDLTALKNFAEFLPATGVTSFLPTTMTMPLEKIYRALERVRAGKNFSHGARILGAHVEGPFINPKFKGAQDAENILPADFALIENFADVVKIITVAPEMCGFEFIDRCREKNIVVSIGHSAATYEIAMAAIERGAKHITHLFNAQTGLHHRKPGIVGAALDSNAIVELIADNVHVHPAAQRIVAKCKPRSEIVLITDSLKACGIGNGVTELGGQQRDVASNGTVPRPLNCRKSSSTCDFVTELGGQKVFVTGNLAILSDGTIAGSVAPMNSVIKNFRDNTGWNIAFCVELATKNPAVELKIFDKLGSLEVGKAADIVLFDDDIDIKAAYIGGKICG